LAILARMYDTALLEHTSPDLGGRSLRLLPQITDDLLAG
jgi:hypothetical protein